MILVKPSFKILTKLEEEPDRAVNPGLAMLQHIEAAGRTCYKSESKITANSAKKFVEKIIVLGHHSILEHENISVRIICDRGVTHELVRHRLVAYSQESTRYCNYAKEDEISVIPPFFFDPYEAVIEIKVPTLQHYNLSSRDKAEESFSTDYKIYSMNSFDVWFLTCLWTQWGYMTLIKEFNRPPQQARSVLPNSLKTEIIMTANIREWRHILKLRTSGAAHPQMREIMIPILEEFKVKIPVLFNDIESRS